MYRKILWMLCLTVLVMTSCKKDKERDHVEISATDYLVFGRYYGMCMGEQCIEIFRLEKDNLFEDTTDQYPNVKDFYQGSYVRLSKEKFEKVKDLITFFPKDLLKEKNRVIGQPDAGDWGGLYIEYNFNGVQKFWLIDQMKNHVPEKYHTFIDKINNKIQLLQ